MSAIAAFVGRILLALIFILAGISKLSDIAGTNAYIQSVGMPAGLGLPAGLFELIAGSAIAFGFMTRLFSILLAGFCLLTAVLFHANFTDPIQMAMFLKNVAIAGGLLCLFAQSQMRWSYDAMRERRGLERSTRDADLRAAKAEGVVAGVTGTTPE